MTRNRQWLNLLLGLVLLVQGFALAAAPRGVGSGEAIAAMSHARAPCHGTSAAAEAKGKASCCDAACPDMTTCALGHLAATVTIAPLAVQRPDAFDGHPAGLAPPTRARTSPLRPPIPLHA